MVIRRLSAAINPAQRSTTGSKPSPYIYGGLEELLDGLPKIITAADTKATELQARLERVRKEWLTPADIRGEQGG
jgi:hypothetical protein